jgi:hypothetical protein
MATSSDWPPTHENNRHNDGDQHANPPDHDASGAKDSGDYGPGFLEWLNSKGITGKGELEAKPAVQSSTTQSEAEPAPLPPDVRAALWTIPLGVFWLTGGYIIPHLVAHSPDTLRRLTGVALIAWVISLGCELSRAYSIRSAYPAWGMWQWLTHPRVTRAFNHGSESANKAADSGGAFTLLAALALPALFATFYLFSGLLAIAVPLWLGSIGVATTTHLAVTITRHRRKGRR